MSDYSQLAIGYPFRRVGTAQWSVIVVLLCAILGWCAGLGGLMQFPVFIGGAVYIVVRIWKRTHTHVLIRLLLILVALPAYYQGVIALCELPILLDELRRKVPEAHASLRTAAVLLGIYAVIDAALIVVWLRQWRHDRASAR